MSIRALTLLLLLASCGRGEPPGQWRYALSWAGDRPLVHRQSGGGLVTVSGASDTGRFQLSGRCLTLELAGDVWTPVLPAGAGLAEGGEGIRLADKIVPLGSIVGLDGAAINVNVPADIAEQVREARCPAQFATFTGVTRPERPQAD